MKSIKVKSYFKKTISTVKLAIVIFLVSFGAFVNAQSQVLQAEEGVLHQASIESNHSSYTGSGFVNTDNIEGSYIEWVVQMPSSQAANLSFRYANGSEARAVDISVNGIVALGGFPMASTGSWSTWQEMNALTTVLQAGQNIIRLTSANPNGAPNVDRLGVIFENPQNPVQFVLPISGLQGEDWVINNYVDLDPSAGIRDYNNGTITYDVHQGTDFDISSFREMDDDSVHVLAAADGRVFSVHDGEFDRNIDNSDVPSNEVVIDHANGIRTRYLHLKNGSITVAPGDVVTAGQVIAVVGSSGRSTAPHLDFTAINTITDQILCPFEERMWLTAPPYNPVFAVMDIMVKEGSFLNVNEVKDPGDNLNAIAVGRSLGVAASVAGGNSANVLYLELIDANNESYVIHPEDSSARLQPDHTYWFADFTIDLDAPVGTWFAQVVVDDQVQEIAPFDVVADDQNFFLVLEAEDQIWGNAVIESNHSGYSGTGFVNTENSIGTWVELSFSVPTSGDYLIRVRYANGGNNNRGQQIVVNGQEQVNSQVFPSTGNWSTWETSEFIVSLQQGENTLRMVSNTSEGAANLDSFSISH